MAELIEYVDTDAAGAGNGNNWTDAYTAQATWESTEQQDLTDGGGDWMHCYVRASSGTADTTAVNISGWITGAVNYILVEAASTDRAVASGWDTDRYRLDVTTAGSTLTISEDYARYYGLQIRRQDTTADNISVIIFFGAGVQSRIFGCRIKGNDNLSWYDRGILIQGTNGPYYIVNTIVEGVGGAGTTQGITINTLSGAGTVFIYNSTIYGVTSGIGILRQDGAVDVVNCAVFNTNDDFVGTFNLINYCASVDNDGTNNVAESGGGAAWPDDFVGAAAGDFTLKSGSGLVGGGIDDPGSGLYSDDINGDSRTSTWDVGADEFIAAVGGIAVLRRRRAA